MATARVRAVTLAPAFKSLWPLHRIAAVYLSNTACSHSFRQSSQLPAHTSQSQPSTQVTMDNLSALPLTLTQARTTRHKNRMPRRRSAVCPMLPSMSPISTNPPLDTHGAPRSSPSLAARTFGGRHHSGHPPQPGAYCIASTCQPPPLRDLLSPLARGAHKAAWLVQRAPSPSRPPVSLSPTNLHHHLKLLRKPSLAISRGHLSARDLTVSRGDAEPPRA